PRLLKTSSFVLTRELSDEMEKNTELLNKIINLEKRKNAYLVNIIFKW
ncbi:Sensor histidine kinase/response regulator, partial [human gut metagenome]